MEGCAAANVGPIVFPRPSFMLSRRNGITFSVFDHNLTKTSNNKYGPRIDFIAVRCMADIHAIAKFSIDRPRVDVQRILTVIFIGMTISTSYVLAVSVLL